MCISIQLQIKSPHYSKPYKNRLPCLYIYFRLILDTLQILGNGSAVAIVGLQRLNNNKNVVNDHGKSVVIPSIVNKSICLLPTDRQIYRRVTINESSTNNMVGTIGLREKYETPRFTSNGCVSDCFHAGCYTCKIMCVSE